MKWTDLHRAVLANSVVVRGWYVDEGNFLAVADLVKAGYGTVHDAEEGHVRFSPSAKGAARAISLKIAVHRQERDGYGFGPEYRDVRT